MLIYIYNWFTLIGNLVLVRKKKNKAITIWDITDQERKRTFFTGYCHLGRIDVKYYRLSSLIPCSFNISTSIHIYRDLSPRFLGQDPIRHRNQSDPPLMLYVAMLYLYLIKIFVWKGFHFTNNLMWHNCKNQSAIRHK